jgi:hypothetical protein
MVSDSLIAFKTSILYILGTYVLMLMQLYHQAPRPYWVEPDLRVSDNVCQLSFASPSYHIFNVQFIAAYYVYNILYLYNDRPNKIMIYFSYFLILILTVFVSFSQLFLAQLYAYESLQSSLVTGVYLLIVITFDKEIMTLTEQIGFQKKLSRTYKFYLLFLVISLFIIGTVLMSGM